MKVLCTKTLYWHQEKGYSGMLNETPELVNKQGKAVLLAGKEYEIVPMPCRDTNTLEYIDIYAIGEDGKAYCILHDELHWRKTRVALGHFSFSSLQIPIRE